MQGIALVLSLSLLLVLLVALVVLWAGTSPRVRSTVVRRVLGPFLVLTLAGCANPNAQGITFAHVEGTVLHYARAVCRAISAGDSLGVLPPDDADAGAGAPSSGGSNADVPR
jgi:hypothetical protein